MPTSKRIIRYAVVGLGHIAQVAVLPAFAHARRNSRLTAVVSGDRTKRREIAKRYQLDRAFDYDEFDECLRSVDAVYIALPNSMHAEYTIRAARAGVHVLCEKPMAVTVDECRRMIAACRRAAVKLMIAYRLHFESLNLSAMDLARRGRLGRGEVLQLFVLDDGQTRGHSDETSVWRWHAVRHRRVLHQRGPQSLPCRADAGLGHFHQ